MGERLPHGIKAANNSYLIGGKSLKQIRKKWLAVVVFYLILVCLVNWNLYGYQQKKDTSYLVGVNRLELQIQKEEEKTGKLTSDLDVTWETITGYDCISVNSSSEEIQSFLNGSEGEQIIYATEQGYYKITYEEKQRSMFGIFFWVNACFMLVLILVVVYSIYIQQEILKPMEQIVELPYELAKGNLTVPLKENKHKLFGRLLWGLDMLRQHIEDGRKRELALEKERKMFLLSLTHDIKTPLSVIKLNAQALQRNIYKEEEKKRQVAESILQKADELWEYISSIIHSQREDFMEFTVEVGEAYTEEIAGEMQQYYREKMEQMHIDFWCTSSSNCLILVDKERVIEILQNIIENAVKYGDGGSIELVGKKQEEAYCFTITNTGCNLDEREVVHIFDSFFRGSNVENQEGSGLGLFICRKLVGMMEGEIFAEIVDWKEKKALRVTIMLPYS